MPAEGCLASEAALVANSTSTRAQDQLALWPPVLWWTGAPELCIFGLLSEYSILKRNGMSSKCVYLTCLVVVPRAMS